MLAQEVILLQLGHLVPMRPWGVEWHKWQTVKVQPDFLHSTCTNDHVDVGVTTTTV